MSKFINPLTFVVVGFLAASALAFGYATSHISFGTVLFLGTLTLALGVVGTVFLKRLTDPDVSVEQMLYKTDHPARTREL